MRCTYINYVLKIKYQKCSKSRAQCSIAFVNMFPSHHIHKCVLYIHGLSALERRHTTATSGVDFDN